MSELNVGVGKTGSSWKFQRRQVVADTNPHSARGYSIKVPDPVQTQGSPTRAKFRDDHVVNW